MGENSPSGLLSPNENKSIFNLLQKSDRRNQTLATAVVKFYISDMTSGLRQWKEKLVGVVCLTKDFVRKSFFIQVINMDFNSKEWEQELYMEMKYLTPEPWFHMFEAESSQAAFSFADESEAAHFRNIVLEKLSKAIYNKPRSNVAEQQIKAEKNKEEKPSSLNQKQKNKKGNKNRKFSKLEISGPNLDSFVHVSGMKPDKSGRMEMVDNSHELDPRLRSFLMKRLNIDISSLTPQEINQAKKVADEENLYEKIEKGRSLNRSLKVPSKPVPRTPSPNPSVPKVKPPPIPKREPPSSPRPALPNLPPPRVKPSVTSQKPNFTPRLLETVDKVQLNKPKPPTSEIPAPPPPPPPAPGPLVTPSAPSPPAPGAPKPLSNPRTPVQPKRDLFSDIRDWKSKVQLNKVEHTEDRSSASEQGGLASVMREAINGFRPDVGYSSSEDEEEEDEWDED